MSQENKRCFEIRNTEVLIEAADGVFMPSPNGLFYAESITVHQGERAIDIGTGSGLLAVMASKRGASVEATDTDSRAIVAAKKNALLNGVEICCHQGSLFADTTPAFDVIIANLPNEIVAPSHLARMESEDIEVFSGGEFGNDLILELLNSAKQYMHSNSRLYLPIHSLTDYHQTLEAALKDYQLRLVGFSELPAKPFVKENIDFYRQLNTDGIIQIFQRNGEWFSYGYVYETRIK